MFGVLKRPLIRAAAGFVKDFGYELIPACKLPQAAFARHLATVFKHFAVDCVLDIGANEGGYVQFLRHAVGYRGLVISLEPIAALAARCDAAAARDPNWRVLACAAGESDQEAQINVSQDDKFSSLLPTVAVAPKAEFAAMMAVARRETVRVRRLDGLLPELQAAHGFLRPYLKTDTQGCDLAVLRGAGDWTEAFVAAQSEISFRPIYQGAPDWRAMLAEFAAAGFSVSDMFPVSYDESCRAIELDCVLINNRFA